MKKILVIYSSQSGQMLDILHSICSTINAQIDFHKITLENQFPFPWKDYATFFDAMPESVLGIPSAIKPLEDLDKQYDLVLLGYQPWFLSPSIPIHSFLQSQYARVLANMPVITIIGCRNMWLRSQEIIKKKLIALNAQLVGNIVLEDKHKNIPSTLSIVRWLVHGKKEATEKQPEAGVSAVDIAAAKKFGPIIEKALLNNEYNNLQDILLANDAIALRPNIIVMEGNGASQFPKWAQKAIKFGAPGNKERAKFLNKFKITLFVAIFILSPISGGLAKLKIMLQKKKFANDLKYYKQVAYEPNRFYGI